MAPYKVATKANPWRKEDGSHDFISPTYGLRPNLVKEQLRKSIQVLGWVYFSPLSVSRFCTELLFYFEE